MNIRSKDRVGQRFGRLTVVSVTVKKGKLPIAECICDCGTKKITKLAILINGESKSCGCLRREIMTHSPNCRRTHEVTKHPIYKAWLAMKTRCYNHNYAGFKQYGGRGIYVCDEWLNSPEKFYAWAMGNGWAAGLSLDRINNDGNYDPINCRWATSKQQARNRTNNVILIFNGQSKCLSEWAEYLGVKDYIIFNRHQIGWPVERILTP